MSRKLGKGLLTGLLFTLFAGNGLASQSLSQTTYQEFDVTGRVVKEVVEPNNLAVCVTATYTYDVFGNRLTDSRSACAGATGAAIASAATARTNSASFSADGRYAVSASNALGHTETREFDARFGLLTKLTGPNGLSTSWEYDNFGRKTKETLADGTYTTWVYRFCTDAGATCASTNVGGAVAKYEILQTPFATNGTQNGSYTRTIYDSLNRVIRVQVQGFDGQGPAPTLNQDTEYDNLGRVKRQSKTYPVGATAIVWTQYTYDVLGRKISESSPDANAAGGNALTAFGYNSLSTSVTNAKGQIKTTVRNMKGEVVSVTDNLGSTLLYTYDPHGNLVKTVAAGVSTTTMSYDARGRKIAMVDPSMGSWQYAYNVFDEMVSIQNSLSQTSTMQYDKLGRLVQRVEPDLVSDWSFDAKFNGASCGKGIGKLCEAKTDGGYLRVHAYDAVGRSSTISTVLDSSSNPAVVTETFNATTGRLASKVWPTGLVANYDYSPLGYLKTVSTVSNANFPLSASYEITGMNAQGQITQYKQGGVLTTVKNYDSQTNRLLGQTVTTNGQASGNVMVQSYGYDSIGNMVNRADSTAGVGTSELFSYDGLNRLSMYTTSATAVSPPQSVQMLYDARGNIKYKSDVGYYSYDPNRPDRISNVLPTQPSNWSASGAVTVAVTNTAQLAYAFDDFQPQAKTVNGLSMGNGNLMYTVAYDPANNKHTLRSETYTSFNMPQQIVYGNFITSSTSTSDRTLSFVYGPEHQRTKQNVSLTANGNTSYFAGNTWYLNGTDSLGLTYEKEVRDNGTTEHKHYLGGGGNVFAMLVTRTGNLNGLAASAVSYMHKDHLNSINVITDNTGAVKERLAYDPWGKRRYPNGVADPSGLIVANNIDRGYTEHEHLDEVGIIHMNGRVYDPLAARFMSADPTIPYPTDLRAFNRYSYVYNNPIRNWDPDGFWGKKGENDSGCNCSDGNMENSQVPGTDGRVATTGDGGSTANGATNNHNTSGSAYIEGPLPGWLVNQILRFIGNKFNGIHLGPQEGTGLYNRIGFHVNNQTGQVTPIGPWSTTTDNNNAYPNVVAGDYKYSITNRVSRSSTINGDIREYSNRVSLNDSRFVNVDRANPEKNGLHVSDGVDAHSGVSQIRPGSEGCITGQPGVESRRDPSASRSMLDRAFKDNGEGIGSTGVLTVN